MTVPFPLPPAWPAASYITPPKLPSSAIAKSEMMSGVVSRLRLSNIQTNAEFTAMWPRLTLAQVNTTVRPFWQAVDAWDTFTLGATWWHPSCPSALKTLIESLSPTGLWMFAEEPVIEEISLGNSYMVRAKIRGAIL
jgi:hypothetical protein